MLGAPIITTGSKEGPAWGPHPTSLRLGPAPFTCTQHSPCCTPALHSPMHSLSACCSCTAGCTQRLHSWMHTPVAPGSHPLSGRTRFLHPVFPQYLSCGYSQPPLSAGRSCWEWGDHWEEGARPICTVHPGHKCVRRKHHTASLPPCGPLLMLKETMQTPWGAQGQQVLDGRMVKQSQEASSFPEERRRSTSKPPRSQTGISHPKNGRETGGIWVSFAA